MSILEKLLNKKPNGKAKSDTARTEAFLEARNFGVRIQEAAAVMIGLDGLLSAPSVEFVPETMIRITLPFEHEGYRTIVILFGADTSKPICATLV